MRKLVVTCAVLALIGTAWIVWRRAAAPRSIRSGECAACNVLLITIDTLRSDRVGAFGGPPNLTPNLDRLAGAGLRLTRAYSSAPLTLPSHTSIMTAVSPPVHGVRANGLSRLGPDLPTVAAVLAAHRYRTGAFIGAFVLDARFGLNAGFDVYDDRVQGASANLDVVQRKAEAVLAPAYEWIANPQSATPQSNQQSAISNPKWFAWVHLYDPHEPYTPPEPHASRYAQDPYSGEIAYADASLGAFLDRLRSAGALDRTLVVITSDHGESLGEHGERTHALFAYESTLRVPFIIWAARSIMPAVVAAPARLVDVTPTILDLVGASSGSFDVRSLRPLGAGERAAEDPGSYFEALNANLTRN